MRNPKASFLQKTDLDTTAIFCDTLAPNLLRNLLISFPKYVISYPVRLPDFEVLGPLRPIEKQIEEVHYDYSNCTHFRAGIGI